MSAKNTNPEYISEMCEEIIACFKNEIRSWDWDSPIRVSEVYRRVIHSPKRRFYVSHMNAYKVLSRMKKGDNSDLDRMTPYRREMFRQLMEIVEEMERKPTYRSLPFLHLCVLAVFQPAPRLYVGYHTVQNIVNKYYKVKIRKK